MASFTPTPGEYPYSLRLKIGHKSVMWFSLAIRKNLISIIFRRIGSYKHLPFLWRNLSKNQGSGFLPSVGTPWDSLQ